METKPSSKTKLHLAPTADCALLIRFIPPKSDDGKAIFRFRRISSLGKYGNAITFRNYNSRVGIYVPRKKSRGALPRVLTVSFSLRDDDKSGGFAGIKIWPAGKRRPEGWYMPLPGAQPETIPLSTVEENVKIDFTLEAVYDECGKATKLRLGDPLTISGVYNYCLGVYRQRGSRTIDWHDPQIYNNGDVGDGEGGR